MDKLLLATNVIAFIAMVVMAFRLLWILLGELLVFIDKRVQARGGRYLEPGEEDPIEIKKNLRKFLKYELPCLTTIIIYFLFFVSYK